jgi:predicted dehydrogenase
MSDPIRIGFIGAGGIARSRHLPLLRPLPDVQVVAVCNRTKESGQAIASEFGIGQVVTDWQALIARSDIDAVFIGTWPYMHRAMSVAALEAGKHCFCQARMAMNLAEARAMVAAAAAHPTLVHMICPPPTRMPVEPCIQHVLQTGQLGPLTSVHLYAANDANLTSPTIHWREQVEYSGQQIMAMGIYAETLNAWVGPYESLHATLATPIRSKLDAHGREVEVKVPQVVSITGRLRCGAVATELHSGVAADPATRGQVLTIQGLAGSLRYDFNSGKVELARAGEPMQTVNIPGEMQRPWRVEKDFIEAVRAARAGKRWSVSPDFHEGLLYMQKVEAVHRSAQSGQAVTLATL